MIKIFCNNCEKEVEDKDFRFEGSVREIKQLLVAANPQPQLIEKIIHLCKQCYKDKVNL